MATVFLSGTLLLLSMRGAFFDCESRSLEEAQRLCENWLVGQDRCYRN